MKRHPTEDRRTKLRRRLRHLREVRVDRGASPGEEANATARAAEIEADLGKCADIDDRKPDDDLVIRPGEKLVRADSIRPGDVVRWASVCGVVRRVEFWRYAHRPEEELVDIQRDVLDPNTDTLFSPAWVQTRTHLWSDMVVVRKALQLSRHRK